MRKPLKKVFSAALCAVLILQSVPLFAGANEPESIEIEQYPSAMSEESALENKESYAVIDETLVEKANFTAEAESKRFIDFFPDEVFAQAIASEAFGRQKEDLVSIEELKTITKLYINKIYTHSIEGIEYLSSLQELSLFSTRLTSLPESIGNLSNLTYLSLCSSQLSSLPESIGKLGNMIHLNLSFSNLSCLPESIGDLSALQSLDLSYGQLSIVPESIGKLSALEFLNLSYNPIVSLPENIGNLSNLNTLYMPNTQLSFIPESIGDLSALQSLDLSYGQLSIVPESIGNLSALGFLELSYNPIVSLPENIGNLSNLHTLCLSGTQLSDLPESVGDLNRLQSIYLFGGCLTRLPISLLHKIDSMRFFLLAKQKASLPEKQVSSIAHATIKDILPPLVWQLYSINPKYFYQNYAGGAVTNTSVIKGKITATLGEQSKSMTIRDVMFNPDFKVSDLLAFGVGTYDIQYKTDGHTWVENKNIYTREHDYQYQIEFTDEIDANQVFSGTAVSNGGLYDINLSGRLNLTLKEGKNALTPEEIASLNIRGAAINLTNPVETAVVNQNRIIGGNIWVTNGVVEKIELAGKAKTATAKADNFIITMAQNSATSNSYSVTGVSSAGQYDIVISGRMPELLSEGKNSFSLYELTNMPQYGFMLHTENQEIRILNNNNAFTNIVFEVENAKVVNITITGKSKTANGTMETYTLSAEF